MRVLHVSTFESAGGAATAMHRLHEGLLHREMDSRLLVQHRQSKSDRVRVWGNPMARMLHARRAFIDALPLVFYPKRRVVHWANAWWPHSIARDVRRLNPDVVHLHWVCRGLLSPPDLKLFDRPIVWTLHDSWPFTGGCHVPDTCTRYRQSCGACPLLSSMREQDLSRWIWNRKQKSWRDVNLCPVAPSRWLTECAAASGLFSDRPVQTIPNGIDTRRYAPMDRDRARQALNLPTDKPVFLLAAMNAAQDPNKGVGLARAALASIASRKGRDAAVVLVTGEGPEADAEDIGFPTVRVGVLQEREMISAYAACDALILPSRLENFSNVALEAAACAKSSIAFDAGGTSDIVEHEKTGYLARPYDPMDLARGIEELMERPELSLSRGAHARERAVQQFDVTRMVDRYTALYRERLSP